MEVKVNAPDAIEERLSRIEKKISSRLDDSTLAATRSVEDRLDNLQKMINQMCLKEHGDSM
tara:strand:- start:939 stop:1121 length:183 start_codon:yes stop_codon:yes gene_type:complete